MIPIPQASSTITPGEISGLITAIAAALTIIFSVYQYMNNRGVTKKLEEFKRKLTEKLNRDSESAGIIYGELWDGLHKLGSDRIYIIQPHPSHANRYLTITMEVRRNGVSAMKPYLQSLPMSDIPKYVSVISRDKFLLFDQIATKVMDKRARSIMGVAGVLSMAVHRLENTDGNWIGSLVCEHTQAKCWGCLKCEEILEDMAKIISPILPEYEG
jgi:hypothetical protein